MEAPQGQEANETVFPVSCGHLQERPSLRAPSITLSSARVTWTSRTPKSNLSNLRLHGNGSIRRIVGSQARGGQVLILPDGTTVAIEMMEDTGEGLDQDGMVAPVHSGRPRDILAGGAILWRMSDRVTRTTGLDHPMTAVAPRNIATGQMTKMMRVTVGQLSAGAPEMAFVKATAATTSVTVATAVSPMAVAITRSGRGIVASGIGRTTVATAARTRGIEAEVAAGIAAGTVVETAVGTVVGTEVAGTQGVDETAIVTGVETDHTTTADATGS